MNRYGAQISERWRLTAPARYAQLENPNTFFAEMGELVLARVNDLTEQMLLSASTTPDYLEDVATRTAIARQATEIALEELEWPEPELTPAEARQEWEATRPSDETLIDWAHQQDGPLVTSELEALSAEWMLPETFLEDLAAATNPWTYLADHSTQMQASADSRFHRYLQQQQE